jgi:hypothetical protein
MSSTISDFEVSSAQNGLLAQIGEVLYGPRWQTDLAREMGISDRTMRRWAANRAAVPQGAWRNFYERLETRAIELDRMKRRIEGLIEDGRAMTLQPIPNGRPEYQIDGIYFAMVRPDGRSIRCHASRGIFYEQGLATPAEILHFFETCSQAFHRAASVKFDMGEIDDGWIKIGPSDVIPFRDLQW